MFCVYPSFTLRHPPVMESFQGLVSPMSLTLVTLRTALTGLVSHSQEVQASPVLGSSQHWQQHLLGVLFYLWNKLRVNFNQLYDLTLLPTSKSASLGNN